jgi:hypothetical protein
MPVAVISPATPTPQTNESRWRRQQVERQVLEPRQLYRASQPVALLWYDPLTTQVVEIGLIVGDFPVQAVFVFRPTGVAALEVPYRINNDFGLTSISDALRQRMRVAGYAESVEAFVLVSDGVQSRGPISSERRRAS